MSEDAANSLQELVDKFNDVFDDMCAQRHTMGSEKYGPVKFLEIDSIEMALEEVADLANYARYTFIKLALLQYYVASSQEIEPPTLGVASFIPGGAS